MRHEELLEQTLGSPANIRALRTLKRPGAGLMSMRQLAAVTSLNPATLSRALQSLKALGVVDYIQAGRSQLWRIVPSYASYLISPILEAMASFPPLSEVLRQLLTQVKPVPPDISKIVLFGSVAAERETPQSDVDLCVLLERPYRTPQLEPYFERLREVVMSTLGMRVSLMPLHEKKLRLLKESLRGDIRNGILLYEKDKKSHH